MTSARKIDVRLDRKAPYELDGGDRKPRKRLRFEADPSAITVCVPEGVREDSPDRRDTDESERRRT